MTTAADLAIIRLILDHQNALAHAASTCCSTRTGNVKANVEPWPGCDSTQILPPCISMMRLDIASPDLSKIEAGQLVLELSDYCIQDIAQTVRSTLEPLAADKKLAFKLDLSPGLPPGHGDGRRLTQVLINLVGNAIKFTDAGEVAIKAETNNGSFHVSVRDTGPGISAADQAKLFQEFQQADNAITRKKGGTGLGLAISKRIIEMDGGKIWVESQPGQGSTFAFTLPVIVERQVEAA